MLQSVWPGLLSCGLRYHDPGSCAISIVRRATNEGHRASRKITIAEACSFAHLDNFQLHCSTKIYLFDRDSRLRPALRSASSLRVLQVYRCVPLQVLLSCAPLRARGAIAARDSGPEEPVVRVALLEVRRLGSARPGSSLSYSRLSLLLLTPAAAPRASSSGPSSRSRRCSCSCTCARRGRGG